MKGLVTDSAMTSLGNLTQTIEQIRRVQEILLHLRDEVGSSNPELFRVLCEGPLDMLRDLHRDLGQELGLAEAAEVEADLWIRGCRGLPQLEITRLEIVEEASTG